MNKIPYHPILKDDAVFALIPQKSPFIMVDKLWFIDETMTISGFSIASQNILCKDGFFREPGIIENMAQAGALRVGYLVSLMEAKGEKSAPQIGYIGAIRKLNIFRLPEAGSEIRTEVEIQHVIFDVTLITAKTTLNGETIASCEMKIFLKKE